MPRHLERRRRRWYAVLDVPKDTQKKLGKRRFFQSLETESLTEAETLVLPVIFGWKTQIDEARTGKSDLIVKAIDWSKDYSKASGEHREVLDDVLDDRISDLSHKSGDQAIAFGKIVRGESLPLTHHLDAWIASQNNQAKGLHEKKTAVVRFAESFPFTHDVTRTKARHWTHKLFEQEKKARATVAKIVAALDGYWTYLQNIGVVAGEEKLFLRLIPSAKKTKVSIAARRKPFTSIDICRLLKVSQEDKEDMLLTAFIWIAMWTGCRIEEIAKLKITDIQDDRIKIADAKTKAGQREIPIHPELQAGIEALKESSFDGFLISGLNGATIFDERSGAISKRFGRLKTKQEFGPDYVFHSIRKTVVTLLENAQVIEGVAAEILGHEKGTMTYGHYSGGHAFKLKQQAIQKLQYPVDFQVTISNAKGQRVRGKTRKKVVGKA